MGVLICADPQWDTVLFDIEDRLCDALEPLLWEHRETIGTYIDRYGDGVLYRCHIDALAKLAGQAGLKEGEAVVALFNTLSTDAYPVYYLGD